MFVSSERTCNPFLVVKEVNFLVAKSVHVASYQTVPDQDEYIFSHSGAPGCRPITLLYPNLLVISEIQLLSVYSCWCPTINTLNVTSVHFMFRLRRFETAKSVILVNLPLYKIANNQVTWTSNSKFPEPPRENRWLEPIWGIFQVPCERR